MNCLKWTVTSMLAMTAGSVLAADTHDWGYVGDNGPEHWGELSDKNATCSTGANQSPIDIHGALDADLEALRLDYAPAARDLVHNGHTLQFNFQPGSLLELEGGQFELKQVHFHSPSENTINGRSYPLEAHFVHADGDGRLAVVGVMFIEGEADAALTSAWQGENMHAGDTRAMTAGVDLRSLLPADRAYYRFNGSLTTPPCSEGVRWLVMENPRTVSASQLAFFRDSVGGDNNRPLQPLNARLIVD